MLNINLRFDAAKRHWTLSWSNDAHHSFLTIMTTDFPWLLVTVSISLIGCAAAALIVGIVTGNSAGDALGIARDVFGRLLNFAIGGAVASLVIGAIDGAIFGAMMGVLDCVTSSTLGRRGTAPDTYAPVWVLLMMFVGIGFGACLAAVAALIAFPIVALMPMARVDLYDAFVDASFGALRVSLACGLVGAFCGGVAFVAVGLFPPGRGAGEQFASGFFAGTIVGSLLGFFAGAILGGTGRLRNFSWRALLNWFRPQLRIP